MVLSCLSFVDKHFKDLKYYCLRNIAGISSGRELVEHTQTQGDIESHPSSVSPVTEVGTMLTYSIKRT